MAVITTRDQIREAIEKLPPDATFDEAIERLVFLAKIEAGLAELDAGEGHSPRRDQAAPRPVTPLTRSPEALRDVESIRTFISRDSTRYADLVVRRIVASVERLETFPESDRVVPERGDSGIREVLVNPYRVVDRFRGKVVEIVTVFHAARE